MGHTVLFSIGRFLFVAACESAAAFKADTSAVLQERGFLSLGKQTPEQTVSSSNCIIGRGMRQRSALSIARSLCRFVFNFII